ncbi:transporter [Clostridia bacterium]|nr:transporter [Clostridia bacterium]
MSANVFNTLLFFGTVIFYLGGVFFAYRLFNVTGLYVWTAFSAIVSNIEALKMIDMFGMELTLGNALYATSFVVTDILSENHGKKAANKAVNIGLFTIIIWVAATQMITLFKPNEYDFIQPSLQSLFEVVPRISLASIFTYMVSQRVDIFLYHRFWKATGNNKKFLWLRNNGSTLISQLLDSVMFTVIAFGGQYEWKYIVTLCLTTYIVKVIVALCDTPILYLSRAFANKVKNV